MLNLQNPLFLRLIDMCFLFQDQKLLLMLIHHQSLNQNYYYAPGTYALKGDALKVPALQPMPQGKGIRCYEKTI